MVAFVAFAAIVTGAQAHATHRCRDEGVRRHHGLGEADNRHATGVRRFHGLGDGPGTGWYGWYSPYTVPYPVVTVRPAPPPPAIRPPLGSRQRGWWLLGRGEPRQARTEFAVLALRDPGDADARAGYALAAAALDRHETAAWAMRRAFIADADAVGGSRSGA